MAADAVGPSEPQGVVEVAARDECIANGGSVSHHHGIGKARARWLTPTVSETGHAMIRAVKDRVDPKNIFAVGNLGLGGGSATFDG